jgi:hypothetical protein
MGKFIRLRGLHVEEPEVRVDFAVPTNREQVLISQRAKDNLMAAKLENLHLGLVADYEYDIPENRLGP